MSDPNDYTVGWIRANMCKYVAAQAFLHREHDATAFLTPAQKKRLHIGKDGKHKVVISVLPMGSYGLASAARATKDMLNIPPGTCALNTGIFIGQKKDDWITLGDERLLWLPLKDLLSCALMVSSTLIMKHSGKVSLMEFDIEKAR